MDERAENKNYNCKTCKKKTQKLIRKNFQRKLRPKTLSNLDSGNSFLEMTPKIYKQQQPKTY